MSAALERLQRLRELRAAKERLHEAALARAQRSVAEVDSAIETLQQNRHRMVEDGRHSLLSGQWDQWWLSESSDLLAERHLGSLSSLRSERMEQAAQADRALAVCRKEAEQARLLQEQAERAERLHAERSAQSASDDRFAARAYWLRGVRLRQALNG